MEEDFKIKNLVFHTAAKRFLLKRTGFGAIDAHSSAFVPVRELDYAGYADTLRRSETVNCT